MKMKARRKLADEASVALLIFIFAILYRALLIAADPYPPGPDLGLHNSIINSILMNNGKFTQNLYHMGGGDSLTHPGFHFFASTILLFTEAPAYVVQSAVAVLFSSLTVLCAYLLTKAIWPLPAAPLIAAFLTAISKHDLDMLLWGGYPNVIALTLIPLIFYIFFRKNTSRSVLLTIASILIGTLTFTHSLSALMFMAILASFLLICLIASRRTNNKMEGGSPLLLIFAAILLGFIVGLPFLAEVLPVYLTNVEQGLFVGSIDVHRTAIVLTRMIPLEVASLALIPALLIFFFSKKYRGRFFDRAGVLFSLWMIVPALSTQSFIIGLYTDYYRLLYFLVFPVIVFLALLFDHGFRFFAYNIAKFLELHNLKLAPTVIHSIFITFILLLSLVNVFPFFTNPDAEFVVAKFYDVCTAVDFDALRWIEQNTPTEAVFVSQHGYGWWISGFGQRVTLSATDPQFLIVPHEFQAAKTAKNLLESSFILENGLIEVRDDGGYVGRYNPMLMIEADWSINSIPILYFNESEITVFYRHGDRLEIVDASQIPLKEEIVEKSENTVSISIVKENGYLTLNRRIEVFKGMKFILFTISIESQKESVSIEYVRIIVHGKGKLILNDGNVGILNEWAGLCGQLIFSYGYPNTRILSSESPNCLELIYSAADLHKMDIRMAAGGFKTENTDVTYVRRLLSNMTRLWTTIELDSNSSISLWDYRDAIKEWSTDYIVFKRQEYSIRKFLNNPMFKLVFINDNIAIFKVEERLQNNAP